MLFIILETGMDFQVESLIEHQLKHRKTGDFYAINWSNRKKYLQFYWKLTINPKLMEQITENILISIGGKLFAEFTRG